MDFFTALQHPAVNGVGIFVGFAGMGLSWLFYAKSIRHAKIAWARKSTVVVDSYVSTVKGLSVSYGGEPVKRLQTCAFVVWNDGTETIDGSSLKTSDPLRVSLKGPGTIVSADCLGASHQVSMPVVDLGPSIASLRFDYLEPGQGMLVGVTVLNGNQETVVEVVGSVKGVSSVQRVATPRGFHDLSPLVPAKFERRLSHRHRTWVMFTMMAMFTAATAALFWLGLRSAVLTGFSDLNSKDLPYVVGACGYLGACVFGWARFRQVLRIPRPLADGFFRTEQE